MYKRVLEIPKVAGDIQVEPDIKAPLLKVFPWGVGCQIYTSISLTYKPLHHLRERFYIMVAGVDDGEAPLFAASPLSLVRV